MRGRECATMGNAPGSQPFWRQDGHLRRRLGARGKLVREEPVVLPVVMIREASRKMSCRILNLSSAPTWCKPYYAAPLVYSIDVMELSHFSTIPWTGETNVSCI